MVSKTRIFTKNLLKFLFSGSEKPLKNSTLRTKFITDKVINNVLNTQIEDYNKAHSLTFEQTNAIINHFAVTPDEINEAVYNEKTYKNKLRQATNTIINQKDNQKNLQIPQIPIK